MLEGSFALGVVHVQGDAAQLTVLPGGIIDFSTIETTCEGKVFTAWYEDADYTIPCSTLTLVDRQMTLYARFIDPADCVTVAFNTMGGTELAPLVFAGANIC